MSCTIFIPNCILLSANAVSPFVCQIHINQQLGTDVNQNNLPGLQFRADINTPFMNPAPAGNMICSYSVRQCQLMAREYNTCLALFNFPPFLPVIALLILVKLEACTTLDEQIVELPEVPTGTNAIAKLVKSDSISHKNITTGYLRDELGSIVAIHTHTQILDNPDRHFLRNKN